MENLAYFRSSCKKFFWRLVMKLNLHLHLLFSKFEDFFAGYNYNAKKAFLDLHWFLDFPIITRLWYSYHKVTPLKYVFSSVCDNLC